MRRYGKKSKLMGFKPISIRDSIKQHIKLKPGENPQDLKKRLNSALSDYEEGVKCACGKDIWVIGSFLPLILVLGV